MLEEQSINDTATDGDVRKSVAEVQHLISELLSDVTVFTDQSLHDEQSKKDTTYSGNVRKNVAEVHQHQGNEFPTGVSVLSNQFTLIEFYN